jgi:Kelch motif
MRPSSWAAIAPSWAVIVPLAFVAACSSSSSTLPDGQSSPPPETSTPAPEPCAEGTYRVSTGSCVPFPGLSVQRSPTKIAPARDHHTTMVIETTSGPWLYVVGGTDAWETIHDDVQRARIAEDGSLGAFELAGKLPAPRAGHCMVRSNERLYLFGGVVGSVRAGTSATSVVLDLDPEGRVIASRPGPEIPKSVMHVSCNLVGDAVYVLGGRDRSGKSTTLSARARIGADGTVGAFENQTPLSPDRSHHASFERGGRLYVVGGLTGDPTATFTDRKDVVFATIGEDGTLGEWTAAGALPKSLSVSSAQVYEDALYTFGGYEDAARFSDKIRRATFAEDGTLSPFATLDTKLPDPRGHVHQTPMWKHFIYSVGGKDMSEQSLDAIDIGRFE